MSTARLVTTWFLLIPFAMVVFGGVAAADGELTVERLRCEYRIDPLGIDVVAPRLGWIVTSSARDAKQTAYQVLVATDERLLAEGRADLWDSGKVISSDTTQIVYAGRPLTSRTRCHWTVRSWDGRDEPSPWARPALWSTGLLEEADWQADFISVADDTPVHKGRELHLPPARQYRREFVTADKEVKRATVYASALGLFELHLNGSRTDDHYFSPGWTDYRRRVQYVTHDVTELVRAGGRNAIGAYVADGWYSGYIGLAVSSGTGTEGSGRSIYGKTPALIAQLEIEYADGERQIVATGDDWTVCSDGPIREADLLMGERYDARREQSGWTSPGFDDSSWPRAVRAADGPPIMVDFIQRDAVNAVPGRSGRLKGRTVTRRDVGFRRPELEAHDGVPVVVTQEIATRSITEPRPRVYIFDLGQNFAGTIRFDVEAEPGREIVFRYGELLHPDGRLMTENLRKARATDTYLCAGREGGETYSPRFTYHGFRYVEVTGLAGPPSPDMLTGLVLHSDTPLTSRFECSDETVNRIYRNIVWTQRANFVDIPTDCPQRDERLGWTGDAHVYIDAAIYNADVSAFFTRWLATLMEAQNDDGSFPIVAPQPFIIRYDKAPAWGDAGVICPYAIWKAYGDTRVIEECWGPMTRFMAWRDAIAPDGLGVSYGHSFGDWLTQEDVPTPIEYNDTCYDALTTRLMAEMAEAVGRSDEAAAYRRSFGVIARAFAREYMPHDAIVVDNQTAHVLALAAGVVPPEATRRVADRLAELIVTNGTRLGTGFLGTSRLLPQLTAHGHHDLAVFLMQSRVFPSWGYEVDQGATTIWERWDGFTKEDGFGRHNSRMNSFSHYAFGAVCEWMFRDLAGIDRGGPAGPDFRIRPRPPAPGSNGERDPIDFVKARYDSPRGPVGVAWRLGERKIDGRSRQVFTCRVDLPANTTAEIILPARDAGSVSRVAPDGRSVPVADAVYRDGSVTFAIGSGSYHFECLDAVPEAETAFRTGTRN